MTDQQTDTFLDTETGLVLRRDPFGGDAHDILGFGDPSEWEVLEEDFGPVIEWDQNPTVAGILINQKVVEIDHNEKDRGPEPTNIYCIQDALTSERRAFYGNFQIDQALGCNPPELGKKSPYLGRMVLIRWEGKREQRKGGRSLNTYTIAIKREPVVEEEPF